MLARAILLTCFLSILPNVALAKFLLSEKPSNKAKTNVPAIKTVKNEAKILQSLDNLSQQSNNEIFIVESQSLQIQSSKKNKLSNSKKKNDNHTTSEDIMLNDGFDELDLEEVFSDIEFDDHNNVNNVGEIKGTNKNSNGKVKYGVGVVGDEAVLINTLDNSNLMDFENEIDIWSKKIVKNKNNKKNKKL